MLANYPSLPKFPIPVSAGIGLRGVHYQEVAFSEKHPDIAWLEIHSENFFAAGGMSHVVLESVCEKYPVSFHGVGLSLGSTDPLDKIHLEHLKTLIDRYQPALVSEHISWSHAGGVVMNDLLPLPYTYEALQTVIDHVQMVQDYLKRQILVENPSTYLQFTDCDMQEYEFMREVALQSGCGILLDINNIYVTHKNHGIDLQRYLAHMPKASIQEIHLAGHMIDTIEGQPLWLDHHGDAVCDAVWELYAQALALYGPIPTLIEWDTNTPTLARLIEEAHKADQLLAEAALSPLADIRI